MTNKEVSQKARQAWKDIRIHDLTPQELHIACAIRDAYNAGLESAEIARQQVFRLSPTAQERATWDKAEAAMKDAIKALKLCEGDDTNEG